MNALEILLVEDNAADAKLTIIALQEANVSNKIVLLRDGNEALEYIFGSIEDRVPKVIFLDLILLNHQP